MDVQPLVDLLAGPAAGAGPLAVLTGAGISTDSGLPDYRGSGVDRRRRPPIRYRDFLRDAEARRRYWARSHAGYRQIGTAQPNDGHRAVTALQRAGLIGPVITQNVDGLHQKAGTADVLDLHGRLDRVICTSCGDLTSRISLGLRFDVLNPGFDGAVAAFAPDGDADLDAAAVDGFRVPACRVCGGILKPDVVFFGESMPRARRDDAAARLASGRGLLVLGSSLAVMSGYRLVLQAAAAGQPVAIATRGPSRGDHLADVRLDGDLTGALTAVVAALGLPPADRARSTARARLARG